MLIRLVTAAAILLGIYGAVRFVRDRGMPTQPAPLEMKVADLPNTIGDYKGEDAKLDPEMFAAIGAETVLDRRYNDHKGHAIELHCAVFAKEYAAQGLPHMPEVCYPAGGWRLGEPKFISLDQAGSSGNTAKLIATERQGVSSYLFYWYQIDGAAYCTGDRQRQLILGLRGRPLHPPIVKVMLTTVAASPDDAEKTLKAFANKVYAWTKDFH